jgi:hypothetical protein
LRAAPVAAMVGEHRHHTLAASFRRRAAADLFLVQQPAMDDLGFFDIDRPLIELQQGNLAPTIESTLSTLGMFAFAGDPCPCTI